MKTHLGPEARGEAVWEIQVVLHRVSILDKRIALTVENYERGHDYPSEDATTTGGHKSM